MAFEEEFGVEIPDDAAEKIMTVKDAIDYIKEPSVLRPSVGAASAGSKRHARMRRVVVTGLGLVTPLAAASRRPGRSSSRASPGIRRIEQFDVSDLPAKIAGMVPTWRRRGRSSGRPTMSSPRSCAARTTSSSTASTPPARRSRMRAAARDRGGALPRRRADRLGHRRPPGIAETTLILEKAARAGSARTSSLGPDQPHLRPGLDQIRPDGPEPRGGHRLLDRRPFDRRRGADDQGRRRRHHARRRRRGDDLPDRHRRLRAARALSTGFNDPPEKASRP